MSRLVHIQTVELTRGGRLARALLGVVVASGVALLFWLTPGEIPTGSCLFHDLTGYSCFTCGMTRSLHAAADGELLASLQFHLLGPVLLWGMVLGSLLWTSEALTGRGVRLGEPRKMGRAIFFSFVAIWAMYGLGRMVLEVLG
jgi:hypothetical protein